MLARWLPLSLLVAVPLASGSFPNVKQALDLESARLFFSNDICSAHVDNCRRALREAKLPASSDFDAALASAPDRAALVNAFLRTFDAHARVEVGAPTGAYREYSGLGFDQEISDAGVYIRRIYPDTPAATKLRVNDRLLEIEGVAVEPGVRALSALEKLAREPGRLVRLRVERSGVEQALALPVARLRLPNVRIEILGGVARIEIRQFGVGTCNEVRARLPKEAARVLLDLRGNPGGSVPEVECIYGLFTEGRMIERRALAPLLPFALPTPAPGVVPTPTVEFRRARLAVLVNAFTASAAEMLAAALQDAGRAWVIGQTTFGKGTTQAQIERGGARLIYTVSRYYRPKGAPLQLVGVTPDFREPFRIGEGERAYPREADFFPGTLARENVSSPRGRTSKRLRECAESHAGRGDRQTAFGLGVLACT